MVKGRKGYLCSNVTIISVHIQLESNSIPPTWKFILFSKLAVIWIHVNNRPLCHYLFLGEAKGAVLAVFDLTRTSEGDVLDRVSHGASAAIAHGHVTFDFDGRDLVNQFQGVGTVLAEFVLQMIFV